MTAAAPANSVDSATSTSPTGEVALEVIALSKIYPNGRGIRDVSFTVRKGEVFGLLGPNGAGKTTTIRALMDFIRPTNGKALLLGSDAQASPSARNFIGFLPGDLALAERTTGRDWLKFQAEMRDGVDPAYMLELAEQLEADLDEPLRNLSTGNRQKIGVINSLMHRPNLLVLDEPASGLDPLIRRRLYRLLADVRDRGGAVLLSSHVLPEVERICDRVGIIRGGKLVVVSTIADLRSEADLVVRAGAAGGDRDHFCRRPVHVQQAGFKASGSLEGFPERRALASPERSAREAERSL